MISSGLSREIIAIFALYLSNLIDGMSWGYSSTAIPDIKREMEMENATSFIPKISATDNQLSWFGKSKLLLEKEINKVFPPSKQSLYWSNVWWTIGRISWWKVWTKDDYSSIWCVCLHWMADEWVCS